MRQTNEDSELIPRRYEQSLYQVATLASVRPTVDDATSLHKGLILQTLEGLGVPSAPDAIRESIRRSTGIALTIEATVTAVGVLLQEQQLVRQGAFEISLTPEKAAEMRAQAERFKKLRQAEIDRWLDGLDAQLVADQGRGLSALERLQLDEDVNLFVLQLVRYHGAEVALFLYPNAAENKPVLEVDNDELFRALPRREDRIRELRTHALPAFVREATPDRAEYIAALLHRAALVQVLQVDSTAAAIFSEVAASKVLFLDTNFVFRLLGLQGEELGRAAREVLQLGKQLKHVFRVSTRTYDELHGLIEKQATWLAAHGDVPGPLAPVAAEFIAGNDYVSSYWNNHGRYGGVEDFRKAYAHLALLLENYHVEVSKELVADISGTPALRSAISELRLLKPNDPERLIEHDALHKVLIEQLRFRDLGRQPESWHDAGYIFLTFDNKLPIFAFKAAERGKGHRVPFCIMGHEWLQLLYFCRPSEEVSANAFVKLINSPYLETYFSRRAVDRDIVREIVATMGEVREFRPAVARRLLADRTLCNKLTSNSSPAARSAVLKEAIRTEAQMEDERLSGIIRLKDAETSVLTAQLREKDRQIRDLEQDVREGRGVVKRKTSEAAGKNKSLTSEATELRRRLKKSEEEAAEMRSLATGYAGLQKKVEELQADVQSQRDEATKARRWLLVVPILLITYAVLRFTRGDWRSVPAWVALLVGVAPFARGARSGLRGKEWQLVGRVANLLGILVFAWEYVPGVKDIVRTLLTRVGIR